MAINSTQQSYKQMKLRNEQPNRQPFKAGRIKYEAPKYLSTAMTPPRTRRNLKKSASEICFSSKMRKEEDREAEITLEEFRLEPMQAKDITELPFEPITASEMSGSKKGNMKEIIEEEEKENVEEWMISDAEKFIPAPLALNPLQEAQQHNDSVNEGEETDDEDRDIPAEIKMVKEKLQGVVGSAVYLNRKIPNVENMMNDPAFTIQDVMGSWDVLLVNIEKMIDRSKNDDIQE